MSSGQIGLPHLLQLTRVRRSGWNAQGCSDMEGEV